MHLIFLLIAVFIVIALYEIPDLSRKKYWCELAAFSFFMLLVLVLSLLLTIGVKIPSPMKGIEYFYKEILDLHYKDLFIWDLLIGSLKGKLGDKLFNGIGICFS